MSTYFLHIGKTGGTAIAETLAPVAERYGLVKFSHQKTLKDVPVGEKIVFTLRDPQSRYVSAFNSRLRKGKPRYEIGWNGAEVNAFKRFQTPNELALALSSDNERRRTAAQTAMTKIRHVGNHLTDWLISEEYLIERQDDIVFIAFQETLTADFALLKEILDLPEELVLPTDPVLAHRAPSTLDKHLSDVAIANLRRWYATDYAMIEFCRKLRESKGWDSIKPRVAAATV